MVFHFKIKIKGISQPPVWRKVAVPAEFTFQKFHEVIQVAFCWGGYHLYEFADKLYQSKIRIGVPNENEMFGLGFYAKTQNASKIKLSKIFSEKDRKLMYLYDFGDNWQHEITLESISPDIAKKAVFISGKGACPPEDCGGVYGYEEMKAVFANQPESEEAEEYREWLGLDKGEKWDVDRFPADNIAYFLKEI